MKNKIILLKCENYSEEEIFEVLKKAIDLFEFKKYLKKFL
jgi:hypothetical protein